MCPVRAASPVTYASDPLWLQSAEVITAAILLAIAGIVSLVLWTRNLNGRATRQANIQKRVAKIQARPSPEAHASDKLSVQQIQDRLRQEKDDDQAYFPNATRTRPGKYTLRSEDEFPTARIPKISDPEQTDQITKLVRPYLDMPGLWGDESGGHTR